MEVKPKRRRRTKKEMEEFRQQTQKTILEALLDAQIGKDIPQEIKTSHKLDMEVLEPISDTVVTGWVNIYKGKRGDYWTGMDIHKTQSDAQKVATKDCVGQTTIHYTFGGKS